MKVSFTDHTLYSRHMLLSYEFLYKLIIEYFLKKISVVLRINKCSSVFKSFNCFSYEGTL